MEIDGMERCLPRPPRREDRQESRDSSWVGRCASYRSRGAGGRNVIVVEEQQKRMKE